MKNKYRQGVTAIIIDKNEKVLLVQHVTYKDNEWAHPGGGVEDDESHEDALRREIKEELNLDSNDYIILGKAMNPIKYDFPKEYLDKVDNEITRNYIGQIKVPYFIKFTGDKSKLKKQDEEIKAYKWVTKNNLVNHLRFKDQLRTSMALLDELKELL